MTERRIGTYELHEPLGRGGQATVWRAVQAGTGRVVALKVLGRSVEPAAARRFAREAEILARLEHPNVVRLHEVVEADDCLATALEYVPGGDLGGLLEEVRRGARPPLRPRELLTVSLDLLAALHYVHGLDLVHRDVKPANLLMDRSGRAHLSDFGLARFQDLTRMTKTGQALGTLRYMSPEQLRGEEVDRRSDLYQAGLVLFEMAWGALPFHDDSPYAQAMARTTQDLAAPEAPPVGLSPSFVDVVRRSLARDRTARFPDGAAFATALTEVAVQSGVDVQPADLRLPSAEIRAALGAARSVPGTAVEPPREGPTAMRRRLAPGLVGALAAGALGLGVLAVLPRGDGLEVARRELGRDRPLVAARELAAALGATTAPPSPEARRLLDELTPRLPALPEGRRAALTLLSTLGPGALTRGPAADALGRHVADEAEARAAEGRTTDAEALLTAAWAAGARNASLARRALRLAWARGDRARARSWIEAGLLEEPGDPELRLRQSALHTESGADGWALASLRAGLTANPGHRELTLRLADVLSRTAEPALRAEARSLVASGGGPDWSPLERATRLAFLSYADARDGLGELAVRRALEAHGLAPSLGTWMALYEAYRANGECAKTLEPLDQASRLAAPDMRRQLLRELFRRSYWCGAPTIEGTLGRLKADAPAYGPAYDDVWRASREFAASGRTFSVERLRSVAPAFGRLAREDPKDPLLLVFTAQLHLEEGRPDDAERVLRTVLETEPDCPPAFVLLGDLARRRSDLPTAEAMLRRSLRAAPHQRSVLDLLFGLLQASGRHQEGLALLEELLAERPYEPAYLLGRAAALASLGRTDEATAALAPLLTGDPGRLPILRDGPDGRPQLVPPDWARSYVRFTAAPLLVNLLAAAGRPGQALAAAETHLTSVAASLDLAPAPDASARQVGGADACTARALAEGLARWLPAPPPDLEARAAALRARAEATAERLEARYGRFEVGPIAFPGSARHR